MAMYNKQAPFVGKSRIRLVDGLVNVVDAASTNNEACWVSLEAPSGWGKTRVVQQLYERLAARQEKRYWPATILEASESGKGDVLSRRKRIYPKSTCFDREQGALPEFMWLGIACELRGGVASQVLLDDLQQLQDHAIYLEASWSALASFKEKRFPTLAQAKKTVTGVIEEAMSHGLGKIAENIANASVPGMGLVVKLGSLGIDKSKAHLKQNKLVNSCGSLSPSNDNSDLIEDTVAIIRKLAKPGLPMILFVEDLHKAPPIMETFIDNLVRLNASVVIITSTWPGEIERLDKLQKTLNETDIQQRFIRIQHDCDIANPCFPKGASLDALSQESLRAIIRAYYPKVEEETLNLLSARFNNPLPLELVCTLPINSESFSDGDLNLTVKEIENLPSNVEALYQELWNALPTPVQQALALSTTFIPEHRADWDNELLITTIKQWTQNSSHKVIANVLEQEQVPHGWTRSIETWLKRFNEPDQIYIARRRINDMFRPQTIDQLLKVLIAQLQNIELDISLHSKKDQHIAWLILSLHKKNLVEDHHLVLTAIRVLQEALLAFPAENKTLLELGGLLEQLVIEGDTFEWLAGRKVTAYTLVDCGKIQEGLTAFNALLEDEIKVLGSNSLACFSTRSDIAYLWSHYLGSPSGALHSYRSLLTDQTRVLGADARDTLTTRMDYINTLAECGKEEALFVHNEPFNAEEVLTLHGCLLDDLTRLLGPNDVLTFRSRTDMANWLAESGEIDKALTHYRQILVDQVSTLGADATTTLATRRNFAYWLEENRQFDEALMQYNTLLSAEILVEGHDAQSTLDTRRSILTLLCKTAKFEKAIEQSTTLLADEIRLLGADHPKTLETRGHIANLLGKAGQDEAAFEHYRCLLEDQFRILDSDSTSILNTLNEVSCLLVDTSLAGGALMDHYNAEFAHYESLYHDAMGIDISEI